MSRGAEHVCVIPVCRMQQWSFSTGLTRMQELFIWCITHKHGTVNFTVTSALRLPGTAASENIVGTQGPQRDTDFLSVFGINILSNQYQKVTPLPPSPLLHVCDSDRKEIVEKVKQASFFFLLLLIREQGMKDQEGSRASRREKVSWSQRNVGNA